VLPLNVPCLLSQDDLIGCHSTCEYLIRSPLLALSDLVHPCQLFVLQSSLELSDFMTLELIVLGVMQLCILFLRGKEGVHAIDLVLYRSNVQLFHLLVLFLRSNYMVVQDKFFLQVLFVFPSLVKLSVQDFSSLELSLPLVVKNLLDALVIYLLGNHLISDAVGIPNHLDILLLAIRNLRRVDASLHGHLQGALVPELQALTNIDTCQIDGLGSFALLVKLLIRCLYFHLLVNGHSILEVQSLLAGLVQLLLIYLSVVEGFQELLPSLGTLGACQVLCLLLLEIEESHLVPHG